MPSMCYRLEACPINKSLLKSMEFVVNYVTRKIFRTKSNYVINGCLFHFTCVVLDAIRRRKIRFITKLCNLFVNNACNEISYLELF